MTRSDFATTIRMPSLTCLRPIFQASATRTVGLDRLWIGRAGDQHGDLACLCFARRPAVLHRAHALLRRQRFGFSATRPVSAGIGDPRRRPQADEQQRCKPAARGGRSCAYLFCAGAGADSGFEKSTFAVSIAFSSSTVNEGFTL